MPRASANGIEIEYETTGDAARPALLLIQGLGGQLISWDDGFCDALADRGFFVIRFDNRDVGLSTIFDAEGVPDLPSILAGTKQPAYTLDDMADDAAGLLDAIGVPRAHVAGISMGGMISQLVAIRHPEKTLSLVSIMSAAGGDTIVAPSPEAISVLVAPPAQDRDSRIRQAVDGNRAIAGKGWPFDENRSRDRAVATHDRKWAPEGTARQLAAIMAAQSRVAALGELRMPVCIVHGTDDPLVPPDNGRVCADAAPGSELVLVDGMGHDPCPETWDAIVDAIVRTAARAGAEVAPAG